MARRLPNSGSPVELRAQKMKALIWLTTALLCLSRVSGGDTCGRVAGDVDTACGYPATLTLVSSPDNNRVDANNCNAEFEKEDWQRQPKVIYADAKHDKTYTLINIDPDPPRYKKGEYYLHWLVSNIKGSDFAKGDLSKGNHLTGYYGPAPPAGSGLHRYMFLAFEEKEPQAEVDNPAARSKFKFVPWAQKQEKLCGPVAGIQFRTQTVSKGSN